MLLLTKTRGMDAALKKKKEPAKTAVAMSCTWLVLLPVVPHSSELLVPNLKNGAVVDATADRAM